MTKKKKQLHEMNLKERIDLLDSIKVDPFECPRCKSRMNPNALVCYQCDKKQKEEIKKEHFDELDKLSLEERVRKIEEALYERPWGHTHPELVRFR